MDHLTTIALSQTWEPTIAIILPLAIKGASALFSLAVALFVANKARAATVRSIGRTKADLSITLFVGRLAHLGILTLGILVALGILGISWTALVALVGAVSLAISLAIQDVLKNFVAGLYLLIERPFRIGETIKVKDFVGSVEDVGVRTTVLRTNEGLQVVVPNAVVLTEVVVNHGPYERLQGQAETAEKSQVASSSASTATLQKQGS
jgi:small-conductance mechanosensitive channel